MLMSACFMYIFVPHEAEVDTNVTLSTSAYQHHTNYKCDSDNRYLLLYHNSNYSGNRWKHCKSKLTVYMSILISVTCHAC